jgi:hypothetical protein
MLAQLLARHGLGTRSVSNDAVSRINIGSFDGEEVAMICVSSLTIGGRLSHLRYLLRRLRQRLPNVPILVGFWRHEDAASSNGKVEAMGSPDHLADSLREAVGICLQAACTHQEAGDRPAAAPGMQLPTSRAEPLAGS